MKNIILQFVHKSYSARMHFYEQPENFTKKKTKKKPHNFIAPVYLYSYSLNIEHFFLVLKGHHKGTEPVV